MTYFFISLLQICNDNIILFIISVFCMVRYSDGKEVLATEFRPLESHIVQALDALNYNRILSITISMQSNQDAFKNKQVQWPLPDSNPGTLDSEATDFSHYTPCTAFPLLPINKLQNFLDPLRVLQQFVKFGFGFIFC